MNTEYILPPSAVCPRTLTIYGQRGWNAADPAYCQGSIKRGYAGLNAKIQRLLHNNPTIIVQSLSLSTQLVPKGEQGLARGVDLWMFAVIVYTGPEPDLTGFNRVNADDREGNFDDDFVGYGTLVEVHL